MLAACPGPPSPARNVKVATYNGAYLVFPVSTDGDYFDASGQPLTNRERAALLAQNILASDVEIIALNEVFDDDARDELVDRLATAFPWYVAYIGNDFDLSDSGLMLFSRFEFQTMQLEAAHVYECGDVEIGYGGIRSECSDDRLGFVEFECAPEYASDSDCLASKGVGLVKVALPFDTTLYVGFSHFLASYPDDGSDILFPGEVERCAKTRDRRRALRAFEKMVADAVAEDTGSMFDAHVVLMGDLNVNGNPFHGLSSACLDAEWEDAFSAAAEFRFTSCADHDRQTCIDQERVLVESWRFTTSKADLGRSSGFDFTLDLGDEARRGEGERLDYVLVRGPVALDPAISLMIPQHLTIEYPLSGAVGELSDHLPLAANLLLPGRDRLPTHSTPKEARPLVLPPGGSNVQTAMEITIPGQMQWLRFHGERGTYTFLAASDSATPVGFDLYAPTDLSRPIEPRREDRDRGFVYVLNHPPYFLRTWAGRPADPEARDRAATTTYSVVAHRHDCTSPAEACILIAGETGDSVVEAAWPAGNPVNSEDAMWFEFYADDPSGPQPPTFHDFAVSAAPGTPALPEFDFETVDSDALAPLTGVTWEQTTWHAGRRERRARGIVGKPGSTPSHDNHLLKVIRPSQSLGFGGTVRVFQGTNLAYLTTLILSIDQEEDDSAHDELRIYIKADNGDSFYQSANAATIHQHASKFQALPQIDEIEDGGSPWPAGSLGPFRITDELPLVLIEDDNEDGDDEFGDYLLAMPDPANPQSAAGGFAVALLATDEPGGRKTWKWSDDPGNSDPDDTSYFYTLRFELTHCPPGFTCDR